MALHRFAFAADDTLLLGRESAGVPDFVHRAAARGSSSRCAAGARSLNVAVAGAIALAEALRQTGGLDALCGGFDRSGSNPADIWPQFPASDQGMNAARHRLQRLPARLPERLRAGGRTHRSPCISAGCAAPRASPTRRASSAPRSPAMPSASTIPSGCRCRCAGSARRAAGATPSSPISWDEALDEVAERLTLTAQRHGSEAVWPHYYAGTMGLVQRDGQHRLRHAMRYSRQNSTICVALTDAGWLAGVGAKRGADAREMAKSDLIVVWGGNPVSTQVNVMRQIAQARRERGAKLVVIDPYRTRTAELADMHLALLPGTDGALACAVMHVLFKEGYADRAYLARYTDDPGGLEAHLAGRTPSWAAGITGLPEEQIVEFARLYGAHEAQFPAARLRFYAPAQRRDADVCRELSAGCDRRLAIRGRRRALFAAQHCPDRPHADRGQRSARPGHPHPRPVPHRADPVRRQTRPRRRAAGHGFVRPEHEPDGRLARILRSSTKGSPATICSSACTSSS